MSLDLFGVDSFAGQYITLHVVHIDQDKLRKKLGGTTGALASFGISVASLSPKMAIDALLPIGVGKLKSELGIEVEASVADSPLPGAKGRGLSEFWPGLVVGGALGGASLLIWKKLLVPIGHRLTGVVR